MIFNKHSNEELYKKRIKELEKEIRTLMDKYELADKPRKEYEKLNKELKKQIQAYKELSERANALTKEYEKFIEKIR